MAAVSTVGATKLSSVKNLYQLVNNITVNVIPPAKLKFAEVGGDATWNDANTLWSTLAGFYNTLVAVTNAQTAEELEANWLAVSLSTVSVPAIRADLLLIVAALDGFLLVVEDNTDKVSFNYVRGTLSKTFNALNTAQRAASETQLNLLSATLVGS